LKRVPDYVVESVAWRVAGEIALSDNPGSVMRKWRELYGLNQIQLSKLMGIKPSVLSDYERGRRRAGRRVVERFVKSLLHYDSLRDWAVTRRIAKLMNIYVEGVIDLGEFREPLSLDNIVEITEGFPLTHTTTHRPVLGYTIIDSVEAVESLTASMYVKLMGASSDRVVVFTNITRGRSVLVASRVSPVKPSVIVLHGVKRVDPLAVRIAILEDIPLIVTNLDVETIAERFRKLKLI